MKPQPIETGHKLYKVKDSAGYEFQVYSFEEIDGVPIHESLAGADGMAFALILLPDTIQDQIANAVSYLKAQRDVVGRIAYWRAI